MTAIIDHSVVSSEAEKAWKLDRCGRFLAGDTEAGRDPAGCAGEAERALEAAPTLPRLLYELAVRVPALPKVQALCLWLYQPQERSVRLSLLMAELPSPLGADMQFPLDDSIAGWVWRQQRPLIMAVEAETRFPEVARRLGERGIKSFCAVPLMIACRRMGVLGLASTMKDAFQSFNLELVQRGAADGAGGVRERASLCGAPAADAGGESFCLAAVVPEEHNFEGIIGQHASLKALSEQVRVVAPTSSTVLILGETGTGKELFARAIHNLSSRRGRPFIKVNCAAIPSGLLESELFGHERGAFTGAIGRRIGRFEMAHGGTLFLDEIGDIPLELQPKLLRVLQDQEFERLGSTQTSRVDVRVVAATSRELPRMVAAREFRADLYYRLNVFPLRVPALRERLEDMGLLVRHFVGMHARRLNKEITEVPRRMLEALRRYAWPGNVRELQNFIERAVILSPGKVLRAPVEELAPAPAADAELTENLKPATLKDAEREHILQALAATNWVLGGPKGAGARLGLARTTLISKMQKLGITRAQA